MHHIVVLGAGPSGIGAALRLRRRGATEVTVLDQGSKVGGLAGSFDLHGVAVDYGSHRLHSECRADILRDLRAILGSDLMLRPRRGRIRLKQRWLDFPLSPLNLVRNMPLRLSLGIIRHAFNPFPRPTSIDDESFASTMERGVGPALSEAFYFPYARKIWGLEPSDISAVQASRRVAARSVVDLVKKVLSSVPIIGSSGSRSFYYPRGGYGQISQNLAEAAQAAGAKLLLKAEVEEIRIGEGSNVSVTAHTDSGPVELSANQVWSTIPIGSLVSRVRPAAPTEIIDAALSLKSRAMVLAYVTLDVDQFSKYDTHYFPSENVPFSRVSEPKNFTGEGPSGRTVLCAEIPTDIGSMLWNATNEDVRDVLLHGLATVGLPVKGSVIDTTVIRLPAAYPVYEKGFESAFKIVDEWIESLGSIVTFGRQGLFAHNNLHHVLEMAYAAVDCLDDNDSFNRARWADFRTEFDKQVVVD